MQLNINKAKRAHRSIVGDGGTSGTCKESLKCRP